MRASVASDDASLSYQLRETLSRLGHDCPLSHVVSLDAATVRLVASPGTTAPETESDLLFVILSPNFDRALSTLHELRRKTSKRLLAIGPADDPKLVLRTLREGADEYLDQSELLEELTAALERFRQEEAAQRSAGRVVALLPASGGCGCSTLATGLAAALAKAGPKCILLDLNAEAGDLAPLLDLKPTYTLADLCSSGARLDRALLEGALVSHSSGIRLLPAPARIADAGQVTIDGIRRIVSLASELAAFVLIDLPHSYGSEVIQALSMADSVLLTLRLDFTSLRNARRMLDYLQELGHDLQRIQLVINRYKQPGELAAGDAESALGMKVSHFIIDDPKTVNRANNNGIPVVLHAPSAKVSHQITALAKHLQTALSAS